MKEELIQCFDKKIYVDTDEWRGNRVKELGGTQKEKIENLKSIIKDEKIDLFLDIGTNYGEFAVCIADYNIPVICFEPNPVCVKMLNKTFKNVDNVKIINGAAGLNNEFRSFFYSKHYSGGGSFGEDVIKKARDSKGEVEEIPTQVYRIDDFIISNFNPLPKNILLKIDVEGFEDEVFKGCEKILNQCKWKALIETNRSAVQNAHKNWSEWYSTFSSYKVFKSFNNDDILIGN